MTRTLERKLRYEARKAAGLCGSCDNKVLTGTRCGMCKINIKAWKQRTKQLKGRCRKCAGHLSNGKICDTCREARRRYARAKNAKLRQQVLEAYGGPKCVCCGEEEDAFLTIDHINNDGAEHRKKATGNIYEWYKKNGFPPGYQVLCMNCNFAKGKLGYCPHARNCLKT